MVSTLGGRYPEDIDKPLASSSTPADATPATPDPTPDRPHLKALDGLRFVAAFCILFSHSCSWLANFKDNNTIALSGGFVSTFGMPLFFVLSGFVIHYNYSRLFSFENVGRGVRTFFAARFARLYPLFIVFLVVGFLVDGMLGWLASYKFNLAMVLIHQFTLTQSWFYIPIFGDRLVLDNGYGLSWSISTEWFFYLWYPLLACLLLQLRRPESILIAACSLSFAVLGALTIAWTHRSDLDSALQLYLGDFFSDWTHSADRWFFYYSPYSRIFEFILGGLTAHLFLKLRRFAVSSNEYQVGRLLLGAAICALVLFATTHVSRTPNALTQYIDFLDLNYGMAVPIAIVLFCVSRYDVALTRVLASRLPVYLGEISYSIYTVHTWTLRIFVRPATEYSSLLGVEAVLRIVAAIAITIVLASATYRLIELPARTMLRRRLSVGSIAESDDIQNEKPPSGRQSYQLTPTGYFLLLSLLMCAIVSYQLLVVPLFAPITR